MANVVTGYHWDETNPEQITGAKLNATGSGTVTNITQSDFTSSSFTGITIGTSAPAPPFTGEGWFDTTQGSGRGLLKFYDNGKWAPVAQGFFGYNNGGTTISRGHMVTYDSSTTPTVVGTVPVIKATVPTAGAVQFARPIGIAAEEIINGAFGIILDYGYATCRKDGSTITAGDTLAPTITAASQGRGTSGNLGSWGPVGGSASLGRWLDASSAAADTEVAVALTGAPQASWIVFKNSGGTVVYNAINPSSVDTTWKGTNTFATAPIGTIAHICQVIVAFSNSATTVGVTFGLRMVNSTVDIGTGAAQLGAAVVGAAGAAGIFNALRGIIIVPETTAASSNQLQYYINSSNTTTANWAITVNEVGVIVGGQIA